MVWKMSLNTIRWKSIETTIKAMRFSLLICKVVKNCISSDFSVLSEGPPTPPFQNQIGIRLGDVLSLLFLLGMDNLCKLIVKDVQMKIPSWPHLSLWKPKNYHIIWFEMGGNLEFIGKKWSYQKWREHLVYGTPTSPEIFPKRLISWFYLAI